MKLRFCLITVLALGAASSITYARPVGDVAQEQQARQDLRRDVSAWMQQAKVPGLAVARIEDGKVAWIEVFGERAPGQSLTRDTVFNVASLTKPVFAMMALQLSARGALELDAPLANDWVDPDVANDPRRLQLTARIALSHQTGLQNWRGNAPLAFAFTPGARHEYSGEGYEYLRKAIERKTGETMPELMRTHVLAKAAMRNTSFGWNDAVKDRVATGYNEVARPYDMSDLRTRQPSAAASMLTTIDDYAHFAAWVANGADLPRAAFADMRRDQALHADPAERFGLGWRLVKVGKETALSHDGRESGVRAQVFVLPDSRQGLVILTNSDNGELVVRPLVEKTLLHGDELMNQIGRDTWNYLRKQPAGALQDMLRKIAGSPSFMSKLLYAADAALVRPAIGSSEVAADHSVIESFVARMADGQIDEDAALKIAQSLLQQNEHDPRLMTRMSSAQAHEWVDALRQAVAVADKPSPAPVVQVPDAVLASYVGSYRVPSSGLVILVSRSGDSLQATAQGMPVIQLHPESETLFSMKEDKTRFEFIRNPKGAVDGVKLLWSGGRSEVAGKVE